jgi:hypothetical protein
VQFYPQQSLFHHLSAVAQLHQERSQPATDSSAVQRSKGAASSAQPAVQLVDAATVYHPVWLAEQELWSLLDNHE